MATPNRSGPAAPVSRPQEGPHLRLDRLASRFSSDFSRLYATLVALNRIGTTLTESVDASEDGLAIELLTGDSLEVCDRLMCSIEGDLRPMVKELSHG